MGPFFATLTPIAVCLNITAEHLTMRKKPLGNVRIFKRYAEEAAGQRPNIQTLCEKIYALRIIFNRKALPSRIALSSFFVRNFKYLKFYNRLFCIYRISNSRRMPLKFHIVFSSTIFLNKARQKVINSLIYCERKACITQKYVQCTYF